ncbi:MAG: rhomboid family intramembrane serine protease [Pirellulales bacterium]|nr:rhomboid family intramembrane serine protease [Pirellulales bacterium]
MFFPIPLELKYPGTKTNLPAANAALIVISMLVYLFGWNWSVGSGTGPLSILMYGFCHCGFWHLLLNMWVLWVFGNPVNRRLGNGRYLLVYLGCLIAVGLFARIFLPVGLVGSSGAIFAVLTIALVLMPSALIETAYLAVFPLTLLLGVFKRPKYGLNWFLSWGIVTVPALWCLVLIPLMELCSFLWRAWYFGWVWSWTPGAHLLGILCGVAVVLMLPARITGRRSVSAM